MKPIFEIINASYCYPDGRIGVEDISLVIHPGESLVILGANASGKSTLLRLLAGLIFPNEGNVSAFGKTISESFLERGSFAGSFRQRVGLLFQDMDAMLFNPTVYDEIAFGPLQLDLTPEQVSQRIDDMITLLDLGGIAHLPPYALSGGEKKKVGLAALLAVAPEIILLDEPTTGLDPRAQRWFTQLVVQLRNMGKTLVTTTHDLHLVDEIADRVVVLGEDHRIAAIGRPHDILTDLELLLSVNLVHEHAHIHDGIVHIHPHAHRHEHEH